MKRLFMILLALLIIIPSQSGAQIPRTLSYQGVLADSVSGNAMHGEFDFVFKLFDAEVGGVKIWKSDVKALKITKGLFSTGLGPFVPEVKFDKPYWLDIEVAGKVLSPRIPLTSVGYSIRSGWADTAMVSIASVGDTTWQKNGSDIYRLNGNVGIGTTNPQTSLHIYGAPGRQLRLEGKNSLNYWKIHHNANATNDYGLIFKNKDGENYLVLNNRTGSHGNSYFPTGKVGIGTTNPTSKLHVQGTTTTKVLAITGGADIAEPFELAGNESLPPGTVVCIDTESPGRLRQSTEPYDARVAGVISGAGGVNPGLTLTQRGLLEGGQQVALMGKVYALATATNGPIEPGDLLTTSEIPGHAMRATDRDSAFGAVIGKAMSSLQEGEGLVLVLVDLQ